MKNAKFQSDIIKKLIKDKSAENIHGYIDKEGAWITLDNYSAAYIKRDEFYISLAALGSSKETEIFNKVMEKNIYHGVQGYYTGQDVNAFVSDQRGNKKYTLAQIRSERNDKEIYIDKALISKYWNVEEVTFLLSPSEKGPLLIMEDDEVTGLILPVNWHMD